MYQVVVLILDQGIRLAQEDIVAHDWTVDVLRSAGREDGLKAQGRKARTEEYEGRILCPEARDARVRAAVERVVCHVVFLLHARLHTDKGGFLVTACCVDGG